MSQYQDCTDDRQLIVDTQRALSAKRLTSGSSGNVSARTPAGMLITPTGVAPDQLDAQRIVHMTLDGNVAGGQCLPSSEWQMHADVYREKPAVQAVVHCHSTYATILACTHRAIPSMHYMVAGAGGSEIPLARYATFGSKALSEANLAALQHADACLLANHGQLATGENLGAALQRAELVEEQAHWYWGALAIGGPKILDDKEMQLVLEKFTSYGQQE